MKKIIIFCSISLLLGLSIGNIIMNRINKNDQSHIIKYFFIKDNIYNKYIGITRDYDIAESLLELFNQDGLDVSIDEKNIKNEELKNNIEQFDLLVKESNSKEEIIKIEEVVLASYEEIVKSY